ncbi:helix-turn-helix domain-containing protein [Runella zeae]|uniref:helix-turn-helix domain-containing protein n=1 Tax=Runella zeae TaxID=94255 RepID=UPI000427B2D6|nr:winged helix-turn-helix domain-containing protein [Runella zeae]
MDYKILIRDEIQELQSLEKQQSKGQFRDYVRFLRLLKSGECSSQAKAAQQVNLGVRQAQRVWKTYRQHGLEGLLQSKNKGYFGKISFVEVSHLRRYLLDDQAYTLADIQAYLSGSLGLEYTIGGVFDLCKRLGIKLKTGRPVPCKQNRDDLEFFKKNLPS